MTTVHTDTERQERLLVFTKGAPDVLLARCSQELAGEETRPLSPERRAQILKGNEKLAGEALRTLGVAYRSLPVNAFAADEVDEHVEHDLVFAGLIGMIDPPRAEAREAVSRAKAAGIRPVMIVGTLLVLDWSLPGGLIEGQGNLRYAQTMAFTTMVCFSIFTVFNARSDERSAFTGLFSNKWLWGAVLLALLLQAAVVYVPFLQQAFSTVSLSAGDWLRCAGVASSVLWLRELSKVVTRATSRTAVA